MTAEQGAGAAGGTGIAGAMDYQPRQPEKAEAVWPVVETEPGVFRLRAVVEAERKAADAAVTEAMLDAAMAVQPLTFAAWNKPVADLQRENMRRCLEAAMAARAGPP